MDLQLLCQFRGQLINNLKRIKLWIFLLFFEWIMNEGTFYIYSRKCRLRVCYGLWTMNHSLLFLRIFYFVLHSANLKERNVQTRVESWEILDPDYLQQWPNIYPLECKLHSQLSTLASTIFNKIMSKNNISINFLLSSLVWEIHTVFAAHIYPRHDILFYLKTPSFKPKAKSSLT